MLMNRLKLCTYALLPLELIVLLALTIGLVLMHALARMLAPAKTVTHRKFGLSDIWMKDLPVLNPWSRILVCPSPDYQTGDEGLLDACGAVVRSVDQVALLSPAAESDSDTTASPTLPMVETVSDDDYVLARDTARQHTDLSSPISFGYLRIPASTDMDVAIVGCWHTLSLPTTIVSPSLICRDHKFLAFASIGLQDFNKAWVTFFRDKCTNADVTIGSHLRGE
jgi:hypothetical protein